MAFNLLHSCAFVHLHGGGTHEQDFPGEHTRNIVVRTARSASDTSAVSTDTTRRTAVRGRRSGRGSAKPGTVIDGQS